MLNIQGPSLRCWKRLNWRGLSAVSAASAAKAAASAGENGERETARFPCATIQRWMLRHSFAPLLLLLLLLLCAPQAAVRA